ncbi:helix-turn-helix domain-containing protein [Paenibacillus campinasensis]|uniref:HTH cro/C1-type domain-containing protein n=1 Tax=Paenibacillus campinasensis TaxID=66347 RepID=A0A268EH09_9BACL|nr:hypothetical protein CHH67_22460 [Paenibacillus campinasensis]
MKNMLKYFRTHFASWRSAYGTSCRALPYIRSCSRKGWSLGELARRIGISKSTLSSYDTIRTKNMPLRIALAISNALECSPIDLYIWKWR